MALRTCLIMMAALALVSLVVMALFPHWNSEMAAGFVYALANADAMIRAGLADRILVVGAETFSRIMDWTDRGTCVLFGDGAGAVVLSASDTPGILATDLHADGRHLDILCVPGTVSGGRISGVPLLRMDGQAVFKLAVGVLEKTARASLEKAGRTEADIDWLIPHQANIRIMQSTARKLKLPMDKVVVTVQEHGNTSAASIGLALDQAVRSVVAVRIDFVELAAVFAHSDDFAFADGACQLTLDLGAGLGRSVGHYGVTVRHHFIELGTRFTAHKDVARADCLFQFCAHLLS